MEFFDDAVMERIVQFIGQGNYPCLALTCLRFKNMYQDVHGNYKTSVEELVSTVAGAELFYGKASRLSRFRMMKKDFPELYRLSRSYTSLEFIRDIAALNGHLDVLKWAMVRDNPFKDPHTSVLAAFSGNLPLMQWMRKNHCPWDWRTCAAAAANGHLSLLQWLRANDCPWDSHTCSEAARNGHVAVVEWAQANGCPEDDGAAPLYRFRYAPVRPPLRHAPSRHAPSRHAPSRHAPSRQAPSRRRQAPSRQAPSRQAPSRQPTPQET